MAPLDMATACFLAAFLDLADIFLQLVMWSPELIAPDDLPLDMWSPEVMAFWA